MIKIRRLQIVVSLFLLTSYLYAHHETIRFGVFAYLGKEETARQYQPLAEYLTQKTGKKIILEVLTQEEIDAKAARNELDILTTNPTHFLVLRQQYPISGAVATLMMYSKGVATSKLGGLIIVRADSPIQSIAQIRGKVIATPSTKHMGGYRAQAYELYKHHIDLNNGKTALLETKGSHQEVVYALLEQRADVGFIRDGIYEEMIAKGEINVSDLRIVNEQHGTNHPYKVSTRLYPEWPVCAFSHIDNDDLKQIVSALFSIGPGNKALLDAGIYGYAMPADYLEVEQLSRELRLPPFDKVPAISYGDLWGTFRFQFIILASILLLFLLYTLRERHFKKILRENEERFRLLINHMNSGVAIYRATDDGNDFIFYDINPSVTRIDRVTRDEAIGKKVTELFPGAEAMGILDVFRRVYRSGESEYFPIRFYQDQKISGWRENYIYKIPTGEIVAIYEDVTDQKNLEIQLEKMQHTIDNAQIPFYWVKPEDGAIFYANQAACEALGYTFDELTSMRMFEIDPSLDSERWEQHNQLLEITPYSHFETIHQRKDGSIFDVEVFGNRMVFNGESYNSAFVINITKRKYYERALRKSELSLKKAQNIAHIGNWELDLKTNRLEWSNEIFRIFEIDHLSFEASYEAFVHVIHPDDRSLVHDAYRKSIDTKERYTIEHRLLMEDGRIKWVHEVGDTEYDEMGNPIVSRGTVQDITDQIQLRHELEIAKRQLEEANQSLVIKNYQLKELAMIDGLTKIANRRLFDEVFEKKYRETLRSKNMLAVLMIDVDNFKSYNDHYGHAAGDECLIEVAAALKSSLKRPTDMVARYGGEEFVVLLKDIDQDGAQSVAERLVQTVSQLHIVHEYSDAAPYITISIGGTITSSTEYRTREALLKEADEALYEAKKSGKNRAVWVSSI